jgi:hypothetical protein|tara:strand:- start:881 stop:1006 length:126 start_codon:yes stop_codon:yes gene_type:complete
MPRKRKIVTASGATIIDPNEIRARTQRPAWAKKKAKPKKKK